MSYMLRSFILLLDSGYFGHALLFRGLFARCVVTPHVGWCQTNQSPTVVDRLAAVVASGEPAAGNLGRLASSVSACMGFRAPSTTVAPDAPRPYLTDGTGAQDADLRAAAVHLGLDGAGGLDGLGSGGGDNLVSTTPSGLRNVGETLGRQVRDPCC